MAGPIQDEFESTTDNAALVEIIRQRIAAEGAITFHDFMETALYHPQQGYYAARQPVGREGDYLTSPEVHPIFGSLVARQLSQFWEVMGRPDRFDIVEQGAGTGRLVHDIIRWCGNRAPEFFDTLRYRIVEISPALRRRQEETLAALPEAREQIDWPEALPGEITGCILSNELIDSFPVHRVVFEGDGLQEVLIFWGDQGFEEQRGPLSTERIYEYFDRLGLRPGEGCVAEVNLKAIDWMAEAARALQRGFVLTFDYGYPAEELFAPWRKEGTLMCFYRHNPSTDPYARIGKQDMTAHVDFTTLMRVGNESGLETAGFTTQARFLAGLGIGAGVDAAARETPAALEEYYARRRAVQELLDPAGLGRIRVLAQHRGVPKAELGGFAEGAPETPAGE